ncbi:hypothetical protein [Chelatococcus asaccharovorans]|uniref:hypothetical protein n=1 Tax=Chelatococcus asaccharovorans TaxID=28210 RepID=UPI00224C6B34|nr:hypothetical protein [Chelatococcus asaccharovorans]CAH1671821.1 hypothetical protein CHELA17_61292 [Chelatococcus asaccharovorans]CAH1676768.1 hypothetical protein CHELA40_14328 [Chelatococcus asaccharovorans]
MSSSDDDLDLKGSVCDVTEAVAAQPKPRRRARKIGGSYQAEGAIVAEFLADDGSPRYIFRFDEPAGLLHIFGAAQLEINASEGTSDTAAAFLTASQLEGWATSIADMVIMWVEDGTKAGMDWRPGLRKVIERRLARLNAESQEARHG